MSEQCIYWQCPADAVSMYEVEAEDGSKFGLPACAEHDAQTFAAASVYSTWNRPVTWLDPDTMEAIGDDE